MVGDIATVSAGKKNATLNMKNLATTCKNAPSSSQSQGFTLIEMVVAASVFAVISIASYATISSVLDAREAIEEKRLLMTSLQRTHALLKNDFRYALNRSVRDEFGDIVPPLLISQSSQLMQLTTLYPGADQTGKLKRVIWELKDSALWRNEYAVLDRAPDTQKVQRKVTSEVEQVIIYHFVLEDETIQRKTNWDNVDSLPLAIEVELELKNKQVYRWLFGGAEL